MTELNRRGFLSRGLGAAAASVALGPAVANAIPPIGRRRPSHFKMSLAAYSFRQYMPYNKETKVQKLDMMSFVDLVADLGFDAVEATSYYFPPDADASYFAKFKRHAYLQGLDVSGTSIGNNFCVPAGEARDKQIKLARTWIDRAAEMDAPHIRMFAGQVPKGEDEGRAFNWVIECVNEVLPYAAEKGVILGLENHGGITATPEQLLKFVKAIDHPNFGVNLDTANFHGEDPYADLEKLAPYAVNVQVKTEIKRAGASNKEEADLGRIVEILRRALYSGYVVLEYEAAEDPYTAVPRYAHKLRALL